LFIDIDVEYLKEGLCYEKILKKINLVGGRREAAMPSIQGESHFFPYKSSKRATVP